MGLTICIEATPFHASPDGGWKKQCDQSINKHIFAGTEFTQTRHLHKLDYADCRGALSCTRTYICTYIRASSSSPFFPHLPIAVIERKHLLFLLCSEGPT